MKLSEELRELDNCGDVGRAVEDLPEAAEKLEQRIEELETEVAIHNREREANARMLHLAQEECDKWKHKKFARFSEDECWLFADDGDDNLHSLVCLVVMSKDKAIELVEARGKLKELEDTIEELNTALDEEANFSFGLEGKLIDSNVQKEALEVEVNDLKEHIRCLTNPTDKQFQFAADKVAESSTTWESFSILDAKCCYNAVISKENE